MPSAVSLIVVRVLEAAQRRYGGTLATVLLRVNSVDANRNEPSKPRASISTAALECFA
jgi:hypothetical protein